MRIDVKGLDVVKQNLGRFSKQFPNHLVKRLTQDIHDKTVKKASKHTKTGVMESNISLEVKGDKGRVYIENSGMLVNWKSKPVNYAVFVHFGTRPHKIMPKKKKALRWSSSDVFHFAKVVNHPGYKGDPFMYDSAKEVFSNLNKIAKEVFNDTK